MNYYSTKRNLTRFKNGEVLTFIQLVQKEAESSSDEGVVNLLTTLKSKTEEYVSAIQIESTKKRTKAITDVMKAIAKNFSNLYQTAKRVSVLSESDTQIIGEIIYDKASQLGNLISESYFNRVAKVKIAVSAIRKTADAELLENSIFAPTIVEIEKQIDLFDELYRERNSFRTERKQKVSQTRKAMQEAFYDLIGYITGMANIGDETCRTIIDHINESINWNLQSVKNSQTNTDTTDQEAVDTDVQ